MPIRGFEQVVLGHDLLAINRPISGKQGAQSSVIAQDGIEATAAILNAVRSGDGPRRIGLRAHRLPQPFRQIFADRLASGRLENRDQRDSFSL